MEPADRVLLSAGGSRRAGSFAERGVGLNGRLAVVVGGTMTELADLGMAWQ